MDITPSWQLYPRLADPQRDGRFAAAVFGGPVSEPLSASEWQGIILGRWTV
jgi:hypothetical protein